MTKDGGKADFFKTPKELNSFTSSISEAVKDLGYFEDLEIKEGWRNTSAIVEISLWANDDDNIRVGYLVTVGAIDDIYLSVTTIGFVSMLNNEKIIRKLNRLLESLENVIKKYSKM